LLEGVALPGEFFLALVDFLDWRPSTGGAPSSDGSSEYLASKSVDGISAVETPASNAGFFSNSSRMRSSSCMTGSVRISID